MEQTSPQDPSAIAGNLAQQRNFELAGEAALLNPQDLDALKGHLNGSENLPFALDQVDSTQSFVMGSARDEKGPDGQTNRAYKEGRAEINVDNPDTEYYMVIPKLGESGAEVIKVSNELLAGKKPGEAFTVGRGETNDVTIPNKFASNVHARVLLSEKGAGNITVTSEATNGLFVLGVRKTEQVQDEQAVVETRPRSELLQAVEAEPAAAEAEPVVDEIVAESIGDIALEDQVEEPHGGVEQLNESHEVAINRDSYRDMVQTISGFRQAALEGVSKDMLAQDVQAGFTKKLDWMIPEAIKKPEYRDAAIMNAVFAMAASMDNGARRYFGGKLIHAGLMSEQAVDRLLAVGDQMDNIRMYSPDQYTIPYDQLDGQRDALMHAIEGDDKDPKGRATIPTTAFLAGLGIYAEQYSNMTNDAHTELEKYVVDRK